MRVESVSGAPKAVLGPCPGTRVRLALLMQDFAGGGAERVMLNLADGLAGRGHEVEIVAFRTEGPFLSRVPPGVPVLSLGSGRVSRSLPGLVRYFRRRRPDVVLSTLVHINVAAVIARRLARVSTRLVLRQSSRIRENARADQPPLIRLAYLLLPEAYRRADHVIAISDGLAAEVKQVAKLPGNRVSAIHNPVLRSDDVTRARSVEPAPHPWLEDTGVPVILAVGRLVPEKDHRTLFQAFAQLRAERPARLVILGEGPLRYDLETLARNLGIANDVLLPGFTEPFVWMKHASLVAHTALWEGFGNVIVEALACGAPVVATDCPSGPREILDGGRYGRLVPVADVNAIAGALSATIDDPPPKEHLRRRARKFTVEAVVSRYEAVLVGRAGM
jgi:glycosyltransferase involved in cell wall biosynthesis